MADRTLQILPGGQSSAPYTYTLPASTAFTLMAVRAVFDGTAAGAFLPCVQLVSDAGVVMAETIGTSVAAGGSADVSFFPLRRGTTAAVTNYAQLVGTIATAGSLRGYWRMGETAGDFLDTSGYNPGNPYNMVINGTGANVRGVAGCIAPDQDDLAWETQVKGHPGAGTVFAQGDVSVTNNLLGTKSSFSVVGWVRPTATVGGDPSWRGGIYSNSTIIAGSPSFERGWDLCLYYPGGAASPQPQLYRTSDAGHGGFVAATGAAISYGSNYMIGGSFDGTTIRLYVNGLLAASQADTVRDLDDYTAPTISGGAQGLLYGVTDEVAVWGTVLSDSDMARLYLAGTS